MTRPDIVEARGLSYVYPGGRPGVADVDFSARAGDRIVLLGPNGSGKTTLLRLLAGDLRPTTGRIRFQGEDGARRGRVRFGYATDASIHFDELTGRENVHWFVRAAGGATAAADALLARFGLAGDANAAVGEYSFGMRRKVTLVQAIAHAPALLLLDEPAVGLDPASSRTLAELLGEQAAHGAAVVTATNDTRLAASTERVVFLHRGRVVADDSPVRLLESVRSSTRIEVELDSALREPPLMPAGAEALETESGLVVDSVQGTAILPSVCDAIARAGGRIRRIDVREPGFDDVFRRLTGEALSGAGGHVRADASAALGGTPARRRGPPWRR